MSAEPVMSSSLNLIFTELLDSEKKIREKSIAISNLRQEIDTNEAELSRLTDRRKEISQEIETKNDQLVLTISDITLADSERAILSLQLDQLKARQQNTTEQLDAINQKFKDETEAFISKAYEFCQRYAINGEYYKQRKQIIEQIFSLEKKYSEIDLIMKNKMKDFEYYKSVEAEKSELLSDITAFGSKNKIITSENTALESKIARLMNEINALRNAPNTDPKFISLKRKIEEKERQQTSVRIEISQQQTENRKLETQKETSVELENTNKTQFTSGLTLFMNQNSQSRENFEQINNNQLLEYRTENNSNEISCWETKDNNSLNLREANEEMWKQRQQRYQLNQFSKENSG